nr:dUTP diphosphatase [Desulfoscipio gibsoniae]
MAFEIPEGYEIQVRPRSGLAAKHGITVLNAPGTVDAGYRGEVKVIFHNAGFGVFEIKKGDRIAQDFLNMVDQAGFIEVEELAESERGKGSFGSTGF